MEYSLTTAGFYLRLALENIQEAQVHLAKIEEHLILEEASNASRVLEAANRRINDKLRIQGKKPIKG
jgi:hypothetical protein